MRWHWAAPGVARICCVALGRTGGGSQGSPHPCLPAAGPDSADATCSQRPGEDFAAGLLPLEQLGSAPLAGRRLAVIQETSGEGVDAGVAEALAGAVKHLEGLGAVVDQASCSAILCLLAPNGWQCISITHPACPAPPPPPYLPHSPAGPRPPLHCSAGVAAQLCCGPACLLCHCAVRGIQQPVPLRRCAVRPARRGRR